MTFLAPLQSITWEMDDTGHKKIELVLATETLSITRAQLQLQYPLAAMGGP